MELASTIHPDALLQTTMKRSLLYFGYAVGRFGLLGPPIGFIAMMAPAGGKGFTLLPLLSPFSLIFAYAGGIVPAIIAGIIFGLVQIIFATKATQTSRKFGALLGLASGAIAIILFFILSASLAKEGSALLHYLLVGCISGTICGLSCKTLS